ncbi:uncharacterized protein LOC123688582 [Harmonia axyridis]|uniref:uncharacterized protein LOC123688582 n=1 Tax=Harmonia axyridis TaxID=115357 RepID=UPI001E277FD0|nr:uncharacterized protein LOC123688582 [Harmonia axyridis]
MIPTSSSSSSSSSSSEEELSSRPKKRRKVANFVEEVVAGYDEVIFKEHFRMSRRTFQILIDRFQRSPCSARPNNKSEIPSDKAVLLTIWYLSNTETFRQISDRFNLSLSSAHRTFFRVIDFLLNLRSEFIRWPTDQEKIQISSEFSKKQGFAGVIGCIDGSHIKINRPGNDRESYINRKGYHIILIQGIADHKKIFTNVFCGEAGSLHDSRLLRKSNLFEKAEEDPALFGEYYLLGDSDVHLSDGFYLHSMQIICRGKIEEIKLSNYNTIEEFFVDFEKTTNDFKAAGGRMDEPQKMRYLLSALPPSYSFIGVVPGEQRTVDYVKSKIKEKNMTSNDAKNKTNISTFTAKTAAQCFICGKTGHFKKNCCHGQGRNPINQIRGRNRGQGRYQTNQGQRGIQRSSNRGRFHKGGGRGTGQDQLRGESLSTHQDNSSSQS